jgi:hypothetical protein
MRVRAEHFLDVDRRRQIGSSLVDAAQALF